MWRHEYRTAIDRIRKSIVQKNTSLVALETKRSELSDDQLDVASISRRAGEILGRIQDRDPVALKNAYRNLFEAIYVEPNAADGVIRLSFTLKDQHAVVTEEEKGSVGEKMVGATGLEPVILRL